MNGRNVGENVQLPDSTANDRSAPAPIAAGPVARNGSAAHSDEAPVRAANARASSDIAAVAERAPAPVMQSRFGAPGSFLKRVVERLTRFQTARQDAVNAQVASSLGALGTARLEIAELRGDLRDAALDFGAIADRMRAFENTRRVVDRTAPFRSEVRSHRRQLAELREDVAALSARLTYVQREGAPVRADLRAILTEIESLRGGCERLDELVRETQERGGSTSGRLEEIAVEAEARALQSARTEACIDALQQDIDQLRMALARDLAQRSTELSDRIAALTKRVHPLEQQEERVDAIRRRLAEVAGALNAVRDSAVEDQAAMARRLQDAVDGVRRDLSGGAQAGARSGPATP